MPRYIKAKFAGDEGEEAESLNNQSAAQSQTGAHFVSQSSSGRSVTPASKYFASTHGFDNPNALSNASPSASASASLVAHPLLPISTNNFSNIDMTSPTDATSDFANQGRGRSQGTGHATIVSDHSGHLGGIGSVVAGGAGRSQPRTSLLTGPLNEHCVIFSGGGTTLGGVGGSSAGGAGVGGAEQSIFALRNPSSSHASRHKKGTKFIPHDCQQYWARCTLLERVLIVVSAALAALVILLLAILIGHSHSSANLDAYYTSTNYSFHVTTPTHGNANEYCLTAECVTAASAIINAMDTEADPCHDFYEYACGGWTKQNPLPDGKSVWGTFGKLTQENQLQMKFLLEDEDAVLNSTAELKARVYYLSCLDKNETVERLGARPVQEFVSLFGGWNISGGDLDVGGWNLGLTLTKLHNRYNRGGLFTWGVGADDRNSTYNVIQIDQGGLGLPTRDYYLNVSAHGEVLEAYVKYITTVGSLMGAEDENSTRAQAEAILQFETQLANITIPADERRDDEEIYHKLSLGALSAAAPILNWTDYFNYAFNQTAETLTNVSISNETQVVVYSPEYLTALSNLTRDYLDGGPEKKVALINYLAWSVILNLTPTLSKPFRDAAKQFKKALMGSEGSEVTWRSCVSDTNSVMGFALGAMFVRNTFKGASKKAAEEMIDEIRQAFIDNLPLLAWMDPKTRERAIDKARAITDMIGFPDYILDAEKLDEKYADLTVSEADYFWNNINVSQYILRRNVDKLPKPANRSEWEMSPSTVNAYYTPTKNQIVFPAGILQTPFYELNFPKSLNFGAMGVVMGHELIHGFDDQGRAYDKYGNLEKWWENTTLLNFQQKILCFVDQYSNFSLAGMNLNGKQTLGENIADNGGLKAAYHAYEGWLAQHGEELPLPAVHLTSRQLFFVGFAQLWCSTSTPESTRLQILNDPHSPAQYRVIGPLSNSEEFSRNFGCKTATRMNPVEKCVIW